MTTVHFAWSSDFESRFPAGDAPELPLDTAELPCLPNVGDTFVMDESRPDFNPREFVVTRRAFERMPDVPGKPATFAIWVHVKPRGGL